MTTRTKPAATMATLGAQLLAEGCAAHNISIGATGSWDDVHRLSLQNGVYEIAYMERGLGQAPMFTSPDEAAACAFYYDLIMRIQHRHCCGLFKNEARANAMADRLRATGLQVIIDNTPHSQHSRLYRVFVLGRDVFAARALLGEIPIRDMENI